MTVKYILVWLPDFQVRAFQPGKSLQKLPIFPQKCQTQNDVFQIFYLNFYMIIHMQKCDKKSTALQSLFPKNICTWLQFKLISRVADTLSSAYQYTFSAWHFFSIKNRCVLKVFVANSNSLQFKKKKEKPTDVHFIKQKKLKLIKNKIKILVVKKIVKGQKICFKKKFQSCYRVEGPNIQSLIVARWGFGTTNKAIPEDLRLLQGSYGVSTGEKEADSWRQEADLLVL